MARRHVWLWLGVLVCLWAAVAGATLDSEILLPDYVDPAGLDDANSPLATWTYSPSSDAIGRFIAFARYNLTPEGIEIYDVWVRDRGLGVPTSSAMMAMSSGTSPRRATTANL